MPQASVTEQGSKQAADKNAIRPFPHVNFPEAELTELRRRINATRWHRVAPLVAARRLPESWPATALDADDSRHLFPHKESPSPAIHRFQSVHDPRQVFNDGQVTPRQFPQHAHACLAVVNRFELIAA